MKTWADVGIDVRGKTSGEIKTLCPQCSAHRKKKNYPCLNVSLDECIWHCWHCSWSGSLRRGQFNAPAIAKVYRKPNYMASVNPLPEKSLDWFAKRGISESVLTRNMVARGSAYFPQVEEDRPCVMFPYRRDGEVINVKYRTHDKLFRMEGGCERILYGIDDIGSLLVWTEGEIDKLSIEVAGITSCVSVPDGAPAPESKSYESKFDFLDCPELGKVDIHIVAVDNDAPGLRLRDELIRRLGPEKCRVVDWPDGCKDANDVLVKYGSGVLSDCIASARVLPIAGAHEVIDYMDDIQRLYREGIPTGLPTGWLAMDKHYKVRPGDVTVITGAPNSGKSEWLDALLVNMANLHEWRIGIYSPEQGSPAEHIAKLIEKKTGLPFNDGPSRRISPTELDHSLTWAQDKFTWIAPEECNLENILAVGKSLVLRSGIRGLVLDPWNEIEHNRPQNQTETEYIGDCLRKIRIFAKAQQVHVWIVAHPQKLQKDKETGQYPVAGPYEISGSANWNNKPDVVISVWRQRSTAPIYEVEVHIQKVRHKYVGRLGMIKLDWNPINGRYSEQVARGIYG